MRSRGRWHGAVIGSLALTLLLLGAVAWPAQAQGNGVLDGQVVNGTDGGPTVGSGIPINLHRFQGGVELDSLETTTDAMGRFRFEGLDTDEELEYWPEALYLGVPYSNPEPYLFTDGQTELQATITVYETTDDDSGITLDSVHMIVESFGQVLRISEIHLFGNTGDRTYVGRAKDSDSLTTVRIPLPSGAVGLAFQEEIPAARFIEVENGLLDTEPVPPGSETALVFFSYHLMVEGETIPLERRFAYPVRILNLLLAQPGLALRSDQLQARGSQLFEGQQYEFYSMQDLTAETPLVLDLLPMPGAATMEGMPAAPTGGQGSAGSGATRGNQGLLRWFGLGLAGLAAIGALVYPWVSKRPAVTPARHPSLAADPRARRLLAELAELQAAFEAGQVDQASYERQRADKYQTLKAL
jgi:hypothetical protein